MSPFESGTGVMAAVVAAAGAAVVVVGMVFAFDGFVVAVVVGVGLASLVDGPGLACRFCR